MWCAVHVRGGSEARAKALVTGLFSKELSVRCFHLRRIRRKKYGGQWRTIQENFLPGYVFLDTDQPGRVYQELKKVPGYGLLSGSDEFVAALGREEADFMECIMDEDGMIGISKVSVSGNGEIMYQTGPLTRVSHMIKNVDLHKRVAEVKTRFMGEEHIFYLGIEIEEQNCGIEKLV